jgi:iron complex transport system substrate-binding protein
MNPEVIIEMLGDMGGKLIDKQNALSAWQTLPQVAAVADGRVHLFTEDFVVIPGPRFVRILELLAQIIHPEVDWEEKSGSPAEAKGPIRRIPS